MTETITSALKKTPLHARHCRSNARMVPFGGWEMPVEYSGITPEHIAVRTRAGVFDVSHMMFGSPLGAEIATNSSSYPS